MRILYASERPPYPFFLGGAARCAHQLMFTLTTERGVQCAAIGSADYAVTPWSYPKESEYSGLGVNAFGLDQYGAVVDCSYRIHIVQNFAKSLNDFIAAFQPSILWTQLEGAKPLLELARRNDIQGLYFVHDAETSPAELRSIGDLGCHVVCSSRFLADKARKIIGRRVHVVYPCPELYPGTEGTPDGYITMINPHRVKGLHTFVEIAKRLPSERFLLLESWKLTEQALADLQEQLRALPNVRFMRRVSDMRSIYAQTRLLLVPSVWVEGFGLVAVEAQSCRIPVIASARGGLPESVGEGGILIQDYQNANVWIDAIKRVLGDSNLYQTLADRAHRHATSEAFTSAFSARTLHQICSGKVSRGSAYSRGTRAMASGLNRVRMLGKLFR